ncbi:heat shock factor 2-binding protein isoform X2 [Mixophyes fleayi]|uniref:heat shock factor 2-binding protein isoform X2 n=1 Tax=Mixophyes fleayi TaxID=3061075 RepID=UPI003F4D95D0
MSSSTDTEFVLVKRKDLERLTTEVMQMRDFLPQILNQELVESVQRLEAAEIALETKELDCAHVSARLEVSQGEYLRANEENQALLVQVTSLQEQSVQQAEYCTHMGSALCSLLWGLSTNEGIVNSILGMDKAPEFFNLASHTVVSFVESLAGEQPQDDDTEESRFVLGLAGTITNVAAVSCGREFLMSSCRDLMESWFHLLGKISLGTCNRLRVLILMSLYNVSINRNGVLWMSQCVGFISQLQRLLTGKTAFTFYKTLTLKFASMFCISSSL